ncbi:Serine/threonine-protein kinase plk1 [Rhizoclosmatium sp. JEL0117]|nr:Serine/threonine-protein kinase plk1 [Rhizoclosmatium sp. JEL0117]
MAQERYEAVKKLHSSVYAGYDHETGEEVAMKVYPSAAGSPTSVARTEAHTLNELTPLNPDRIVNFKAFFKNSKDQYVVVMERAEYTVQDVLNARASKSLTEHETRIVVHAILDALATLHSKFYVHRDVQPSNFLLFTNDLNSCKLGDLNNSAEDNHLNTGIIGVNGTKGYNAPEVVNNKRYGRPADMWSLGMTTYQLLFGELPFKERGGLFSIKHKLTFPANIKVSNEARDFIQHLLIDDPSDRYTVEQALEHPWVKPLRTSQFSAVIVSNLRDPRELVPGFPGWYKVIPRDGGREYYYDKASGHRQWNHPEAEPYVLYDTAIVYGQHEKPNTVQTLEGDNRVPTVERGMSTPVVTISEHNDEDRLARHSTVPAQRTLSPTTQVERKRSFMGLGKRRDSSPPPSPLQSSPSFVPGPPAVNPIPSPEQPSSELYVPSATTSLNRRPSIVPPPPRIVTIEATTVPMTIQPVAPKPKPQTRVGANLPSATISDLSWGKQSLWERVTNKNRKHLLEYSFKTEVCIAAWLLLPFLGWLRWVAIIFLIANFV